MFEFFVALFGGVHYGGKILAESAEVKGFDKSSRSRIVNHDLRLQEWKSKVYDRATEEDLKCLIADPRNYEKVWEEVHEAYIQMPEHRSYTTILLHDSMVLQHYGKGTYTKKQRETIAKHGRDRALSIMLAKRGKVCSAGVLDRSTVDLLHNGDGQMSKKVWDETFEFWTYIRDELRRNGVDAQLIFKTGLFGSEDKQVAYDVDDVEKFRYKAGQLTWLPLTYYDENAQYIGVYPSSNK